MLSLEASKPFRQLDAAELNTLRKIAREQRFSAGQEVFHEGDRGDGVYVVRDGLVEISVLVAPGNRRVFAQIDPGEMFGEMAVLEYKPRSATATAAKDSVVYFIPRDELLTLVQQSAALSLEMLREISQRLRDFNQRYIQEILQAERLAIIGRFARSIVHDLKNPLNVISLTSEVSAMEQATPELRKKASVTIRKQVERVSEMITEIFLFTQGAPTDVILTPLDFAPFAQQLLEELRPEVELRGSKLEADGIPPVRLPFDPKRLRRVFFNLVHNATDAMPGGGKVLVRFRANQHELSVEIEDTGSGIAPEIADKLFEAFATCGKAHGTGLGLSICKRIVEDHHGKISARNAPGHGAIFCFTLPIRGT